MKNSLKSILSIFVIATLFTMSSLVANAGSHKSDEDKCHAGLSDEQKAAMRERREGMTAEERAAMHEGMSEDCKDKMKDRHDDMMDHDDEDDD